MTHMNAQRISKDKMPCKNSSDIETEQEMDKPYVLVDTVEDLRETVSALSRCSEVAFDLEMHSYRTYHGITCLIQLSGGSINYIVGGYLVI